MTESWYPVVPATGESRSDIEAETEVLVLVVRMCLL